MHWKISKEFEFCYGHRVWSQTLNTEFSLDGCLKCRHLHGHQGKILVYLEASELNDGMVTDFKHLTYSHLRAHENKATVVCRVLIDKKNRMKNQ